MKNAVLSLLFLTGTVFTLTSAGLSSSTNNESVGTPSCIYECGVKADELFERHFFEHEDSWEDAHAAKIEFLNNCYDGCI